MLKLMYKAESVGPVCDRVAKVAPKEIKVYHCTDVIPFAGTLVRWGSKSAKRSEKTLNSVQSVTNAKNKVISRRLLKDLSPRTWFEIDKIPDNITVVIRPIRHHGGEHFYLCNNLRQIRVAVDRCPNGWYASEFIDKSEEFRVFVLQGYVICVSQRFPAHLGDLAWNLNAGGKLLNVKRGDWTIPVLKAAIDGAKALELDWAAMDVCTSKEGKVYVFEGNTAPGLRNKYTIGQIVKCLLWADKNKYPEYKPGKSWKTIIHPALRGEV